MNSLLTWLAMQPGPVVANMMFHSNELVPAGSPYCETEEAVQGFMLRLEESLFAAKGLGYEFTTLSQAARNIEALL